MNTLNQKTSNIQIISLSFLGDVLLALYIYFVYSTPSFLGPLVKKAIVLNGASDQMDQGSLSMLEQQLQQIAHKSLLSGIGFIIILHLIIYYCFFKGKAFAKNYVYSYAIMAVIGAIIAFVLGLTSFEASSLFFIVWGGLYFIVFKIFKAAKNKE